MSDNKELTAIRCELASLKAQQANTGAALAEVTMSAKPTVGRIVHFYTAEPSHQFNGQSNGPYAAIVSQVFDDGRYVNLKVCEPFGGMRDEGSVSHYDDMPGGAPYRYWVWPPRE